MKVGEIAKRLQVSTPTVRNWAAEFDQWLSPSANPGPGVTRDLTAQDLDTLAAVHFYRSQGLASEEIQGKLASGDIEFEKIPTPEPEPLPGQDQALVAVDMVYRILDDLRTENAELRDRIGDLERQNAKLEAQLLYHQKSLLDRILRR